MCYNSNNAGRTGKATKGHIMASTKYAIIAVDAEGNETEVDTRSNKNAAIKLADDYRANEKVAVKVISPGGQTVHAVKAPGSRMIVNKTKPWTRIEAQLPEGIKLPAGFHAVYLRKRAGLAVLRNDERKYLVLELATGKTTEATNTKETAAIMRDAAKVLRDAKAAEKAAAKAAKAEAAAAKKAASAETEEPAATTAA